MKGLLVREKIHRVVQTAILGAGMLALLLWSGWQILGLTGLAIFGAGGIIMVLFLSRRSPAAALAHGIPIRVQDAPELHQTLRSIASRAGLPAPPALYLIPSPFMNALSVGSQADSAILLTQGIVSRLTLRELAGVIAHEVSHIRNNDLWIFNFANYLRQATSFISRFGWILLIFSLPVFLFSGTTLSFAAIFALIASPLLSYLMQLALLRSREFAADLGAVELTGDPAGLSSALTTIERPNRTVFDLFFPVRNSAQGSAIFRTHPATEERIKRLNGLSRSTRAQRRGPEWSGDESGDDPNASPNVYYDGVPQNAPEWFRRR